MTLGTTPYLDTLQQSSPIRDQISGHVVWMLDEIDGEVVALTPGHLRTTSNPTSFYVSSHNQYFRQITI